MTGSETENGFLKDESGTVYYPGEDGVLRARGAEDLYTELPSAGAENGSAPAAPIKRQAGNRYETVIMIEGMEETLRYEHVRNDMVGFKMDNDYESFVRRAEPGRDRFISIYDDADAPENYLEVTYREGGRQSRRRIRQRIACAGL